MNYVSWLPADGEIPPTIFEEISKKSNTHEVVVPYPINSFKARPFSRALLSKIFRTAVNFIFKIQLRYQNGNNIYPLDMIKNVTFINKGFLIHLEVLLYCIKNKNANIIQVPFSLEQRTSGESKAISLKNILDIFSGVLNLKKRY
jgi:hypothetical protein